jgi:hypothetical protein
MKLGLMQPYFLPYLGYFQLIAAVDLFIFYDNIQYTRKGWINRNRFLLNGSDALFTVPLRKDSDYLDVNQRTLSADFDRKKLLNKFSGAYARAPHFGEVYPILERVIQAESKNLFDFVHSSIVDVCAYLRIDTPIRSSSGLEMDHQLRGQDRVLATCRAVGATTYINAIGGTDLYSQEIFAQHGVNLRFIKSSLPAYRQFSQEFVPGLSIIDVMMFNDRDQCAQMLEEYSLV